MLWTFESEEKGSTCDAEACFAWFRWRYLEARKDALVTKRYVLYERALKALPGSYKVIIASDVQQSSLLQRALKIADCTLHPDIQHQTFRAMVEKAFADGFDSGSKRTHGRPWQ